MTIPFSISMDMSILVNFLLFGLVASLYEDQIGKFDWRQQYFGKVEDFALSKRNNLKDQLFISSSSHVLGSVSLHNGSVIWRNTLEANGTFIGFKLCGDYIITISRVPAIILRIWDAKKGLFFKEFPFSASADSSAIVCDPKQDLIMVYIQDRIVSLEMSTSPEILFQQKFPMELNGYDSVVDFSSTSEDDSSRFHMLLSNSARKKSLAYVLFGSSSYSNLSSLEMHKELIEEPKGHSLKSCKLHVNMKTTTITCIEADSLFSGSLRENEKFEWNRIRLKSNATILHSVTDKTHLVVLDNGQRALYANDGTGSYSLASDIPNIFHVFPWQDSKPNSVIILESNQHKNFGNVHVHLYDLGSKSILPSDFKRPLTLGELEKAVYVKNYDSFLFFSKDYSIQLISKEGSQVWVREESLAHITAVEFVDLPVSAQQASMQDEFGNMDAGLLQLFTNRVISQANQLRNAITTFLASLSFSSSDTLIKSDSWTGEHSGHSEYRPLTRDAYNLHKMIVVFTSTGKLFGIESARGTIIWDFVIPKASLVNDGRLAHLFQQRTTGHFPLGPIASVLLRSESGLPLLFFFDPISGLPLNRDLRPVSSDGLEDCLVPLSKPILQVSLLPGHISDKTNHIRPLLILYEDLDVAVFPEILASRADLLPSPFFLMYTVDANTASLTGYRIQQRRTSTTSKLSTGSSLYKAHHAWHIILSSADAPQQIVSLATRPANEHIYSIGRVLGDRNVLYKYVNPNLIAVLTKGSSILEKVDVVSIYLIDLVIGQIIHSAAHRYATLPVSLLVSENWVLYSLYNQRSLRTEFTILELFEPKNGVTSLVPSPWEIIGRSLLPLSWQNYFALQRCISQTGDDELVCKDRVLSKLSNSRVFSSQHRAANWAFPGTNRSGTATDLGLLIPEILQRSYILPSSIRPGCVTATLTERGITAKSLLFGLNFGYILELPKSLLDPRRTLDVTPELMEEGLEPYAPELPVSTLSVVTYYNFIERIQSIYTTPSGLESTSLVFSHGLDLFFTRIAPSKTFDLLRDDFDHWFIAMITIGMLVGSIIASRLAARKEMRRAWR